MSMIPKDEPRRPAIFFDRDGVLNLDVHYARDPSQLVWTPGAFDAVRLCNQVGLLVFVVTNQSGVARGYFGEEAVEVFHRKMREDLAGHDAWVDEFRYCPHLAEASVEDYRQDCNCRKPKPGMILSLINKWKVDPHRSFLVGDKDSDIVAAERAGIAGYKFTGGSLNRFVEDILASGSIHNGIHVH